MRRVAWSNKYFPALIVFTSFRNQVAFLRNWSSQNIVKSSLAHAGSFIVSIKTKSIYFMSCAAKGCLESICLMNWLMGCC